ncbi:MAG: hypothetical protein ABI831_16065, partial [Betaproteobacteria bacterium]
MRHNGIASDQKELVRTAITATPDWSAFMREFWKKAGLIGLGVTAGIMLSLNFSAVANREAPLGLPLDDLRILSDVFGK